MNNRSKTHPNFHQDYKDGTWRNVTPADATAVGIGFDMADGSIIRIALDIPSALMMSRLMIEHTLDYINQHGSLPIAHLESSSGSPSVDVSTPLECE